MQISAPEARSTRIGSTSAGLLKIARRYGGTCRLHAQASLKDLAAAKSRGCQIMIECMGLEHAGLFLLEDLSSEKAVLTHINTQEKVEIPLGKFARAWYAGKNRGWMMTIEKRS
jgi:hypothetical protein